MNTPDTEVCEICHGFGNNGADDASCLNCGGSGKCEDSPDTEWEKIREDKWHQVWRHKEHGERLINTELLNYILTSRDTYWKERVEEEVPNALHEYARWLLENPNAEPLQRRAKKNEIACAITNEDNLK